MISEEFRAAVSDNNRLRARVLLKDSLLSDTTFKQFDEMLSYVKDKIPDIMLPFDGKNLEKDSLKWNRELMNLELVKLVSNFSCERVDHLKAVISKVIVGEIPKKTMEKTEQSSENSQNCKKSGNSTFKPSEMVLAEVKKRHHTRAMSKMTKAASEVSEILQNTQKRGKKWRMDDVEKMEHAAKMILEAARELQTL
ncbi:hypothetical protein D3Z55_03320 [Clostridiaceae bacterium]|jgi:hypothetical protein|nr:hypothetical protein [Clostridiaceae bacterium]